ncbi:hypothetical protein CC1G_03483 [Coprinopsis cinerea okayama7|uniref:Uncharacterized protein n=1 Tax=Coprinopsis cinerea (strain Okayama-7 / 130 / ATCC MYA-4618 / FGSC 9003) TaxID=240176 RepID=A8NCC5_COPC7|nr:hypothetical protein CC1G_03483 [Coprinopsis cinerea okayama7\|eukprot:XP_001832469.2 hypothetical protein CC1G_03483 [Coprinopsis cinerea okayama7\
MARTRKYKSEEDLRRAKCEKSKRSNKEDINTRRREKYARQRSSVSGRKTPRKPKSDQKNHYQAPASRTKSPRRDLQVECLVEQAEKIFLDWRLVINQSSRKFLDRLCSDYLRLRSSDDPQLIRRTIETHLSAFERSRERLEELHRKVLQISGTGESLKRIEGYTKPIVDLIVDLEDVAAEMDVDGEKFARRFSMGSLYYQRQEE